SGKRVIASLQLHVFVEILRSCLFVSQGSINLSTKLEIFTITWILLDQIIGISQCQLWPLRFEIGGSANEMGAFYTWINCQCLLAIGKTGLPIALIQLDC